MNQLITELFGIVGSLGVLISMFCNTDSIKGSLWLRHLNNIGSVFYIVYGILLGAWSTIALNVFVIFVNSYHIIKLHKQKRATQDK